MTKADKKFMTEMGIEPCVLDGPFPGPLPPPLPPGPVIPSLPEKDARWILNLGVVWEPQPEPGPEPPRTFRENLDRLWLNPGSYKFAFAVPVAS